MRRSPDLRMRAFKLLNQSRQSIRFKIQISTNHSPRRRKIQIKTNQRHPTKLKTETKQLEPRTDEMVEQKQNCSIVSPTLIVLLLFSHLDLERKKAIEAKEADGKNQSFP